MMVMLQYASNLKSGRTILDEKVKYGIFVSEMHREITATVLLHAGMTEIRVKHGEGTDEGRVITYIAKFIC